MITDYNVTVPHSFILSVEWKKGQCVVGVSVCLLLFFLQAYI